MKVKFQKKIISYPKHKLIFYCIVFYASSECWTNLYSREQVWRKVKGRNSGMDQAAVYQPECDGYGVMKLSVIHGMFKMKINGDSMCNDVSKEQVNVIKDGAMQFHSESMNCIKFQFFINSLPIKKEDKYLFVSYASPVLTSPSKPIPLVVVGSGYPLCECNWTCLERIDVDYPNTCALFVNSPGLYKCSVISRNEEVYSTVFDVSYTPVTGILKFLCYAFISEICILF